MTGPWEKYGQGGTPEGPWSRFAPEAEAAPPSAPATTSVRREASKAFHSMGEGAALAVGGAPDLVSVPINAAIAGVNKLAGTEIPTVSSFGDLLTRQLREGVAEANDPDAYGRRKAAETFPGNLIPDSPFRIAGNLAGRLGAVPIDDASLTSGERFVSNAQKFGFAMATGGSLGALRAASPTVAATPSAGRVILDTVAPIRDASLKPIIGDVGAGAGMAAAQTAIDTNREALNGAGPLGTLVEAVAPLAGGVAGAGVASAARGIGGKVASEAKAAFLPPDTSLPAGVPGHVTDAAARRLQGAAVNPSLAARSVDDSVASLRGDDIQTLPAAGLLADDPGVAGLYDRSVRQSGRNGASARDAQRTRTVATEARGRVDDMGAGGDASAPGTFADTRVASMRNADNQALADVGGRRAALEAEETAAGAPYTAYDADRRAADARAIDSAVVDGSLRPMTETKNRLFAAAGRSEAPVSVEPIAQAAATVRRNAEALPEAMRGAVLPEGTLAAVDSLDGTMSLGGVVQMRPIVSAQEAQARQAGNYPLANNLRTIKTGIGDAVDAAARDGEPLAAAAVDYHRLDFAPVHSRGPGDPATKFRRDFNRDPNNRSTTPPSETAGRFLNTPENAQSLGRVFETTRNPQSGYDAARGYLLADMASSGVLDRASGRINLTHLRRWLGERGETARAIPGLREELDGIARQAEDRAGRSQRLASDLEAATRQQALTEEQISSGVLGLMTGRDPRNLVGALLGAPDPRVSLRDAVALTKDSPEARRGLIRAIGQYVGDEASSPNVTGTTNGSRSIVPEKLENLLTRFGDALSEALPPAEMQRLRAAQAQLRPGMARGATVAGDAAAGRPGLGARAADIAIGAHLGPGAGFLTRAGRAIANAIPGSATPRVDRLVQDALLDQPETLGQLLTRALPPKRPAANWRPNALLGAAAGAQNTDR